MAKAIRGVAGAMKDLEDRQKSRATRLKRDALDRALLDLAAFYRDVLAVQVGAAVDLASAGHEADVRRLAEASSAESSVRRIQAVMTCRERLELNVAPLLAVEEMTLALAAGLRLTPLSARPPPHPALPEYPPRNLSRTGRSPGCPPLIATLPFHQECRNDPLTPRGHIPMIIQPGAAGQGRSGAAIRRCPRNLGWWA